MKQCSCADEADAIAYRGDACRHFGAMGVTMKDGEKSDNGRGDERPRFKLKRNCDAEHHNRQANCDFSERQPDAMHAGNGRQCHHANKHRGQEPQRAPAQASGEQPDRDHCENMVDAAKRMRETVNEAIATPNGNVGGGGNGDETDGGRTHARDGASHRSSAARLIMPNDQIHVAAPNRDPKLCNPVFSRVETLVFTAMSG